MAKSPRFLRRLLVAGLFTCFALAILTNARAEDPLVRALQPAELSVVVGPGKVMAPDGKKIKIPETRLTFAPPEIRELTVTGTTPRDFADWYTSWDPWPAAQSGSNGITIANSLDLTPHKDERGTLILGALYRAFIPDSLVVTSKDGSTTFEKGKDYVYNADWGQIANHDGHLGTPGESQITAKIKYATDRLDLIQVDAAGKVTVKQGVSSMVCPELPEPDAGNVTIAGIHIAPWLAAMNPYYDAEGGLKAKTDYAISQHDVNIIHPAPPVQPINKSAIANSLKTLQEGKELKIAFLGASISVGAETPLWWADLWTEKNLGFTSRVVTSLRKYYPNATVTPIPVFQGATTAKYGLEKIDKDVLPSGANLLLIDFGANDAGGPVDKPPRNPPDQFKKDMRAIIEKAKGGGMDVMILIGQACSPWLKNKMYDRWPEYRKAMLELADEEHVAAADISTEMANLSTRGIPPFTQLHNNLNHPGILGHKVYADVILRFFEPVTGATASKDAADTTPAVAATLGNIPQPDATADSWAWAPQPLPPLDQVLAKAAHNPHIYGVYQWALEYLEYRDSIKKVGWRSYRCGGGLARMTDEAMRAFAEDGTEIMFCASSPAQKPDATPEEDGTYVQAYTKDLTTLLTRYGPNGTFFHDHPEVPNHPILNVEIWNEPNFQYLIKPDQRPLGEMEAARAALYAKILPAAYDTIKAYSKDVNVIGFGAGGASAGDIRFIKAVHAAAPDMVHQYDILSTHPYTAPAPPEAFNVEPWGRFSVSSSLAEIRADLASHNRADAPIWYTEVGWPISKEAGGYFEGGHKDVHVSPELQAAYVCRLYALAQRLGVLRVHIMSLNDADHYNSGFFYRDGSWRQSAYAVQTMIHLMPSPKLLGAVSDGEDGYFAYRFSPGEDAAAKPVIMAWNVAGPKVVDLPVKAARVTIVDMLGHAQTLPVKNGSLHLEIGPLPIYVCEK